MAATTGPVLVTGGSGYIALELISQLLTRGYTVDTTVRSLQNNTKVQPLKDPKEKHPQGKLLLFEADHLQAGSFRPAIRGHEIVYHVAYPFKVPEKIRDSQKEIVEPAVEARGMFSRVWKRRLPGGAYINE